MSTLKNNTTAHRIALLATKGELIFHIDDLANLWNIQNPNTLRVTLRRYTQNGLLHRIYRGFYSIIPLNELNPVLMGAKALHKFCYLSTESVLFNAGYLSQNMSVYTFISEKSIKFQIDKYNFISRQLKDEYLYQSEGIYRKNGVNWATNERAIADLIYFNANAHFDKPVDWKKIKAMQKKIGYPLTPERYDLTQP